MTTQLATPMIAPSSSGLVVRLAATDRPRAHSHQASGCSERGQPVDDPSPAGSPRCDRRHAVTPAPAPRTHEHAEADQGRRRRAARVSSGARRPSVKTSPVACGVVWSMPSGSTSAASSRRTALTAFVVPACSGLPAPDDGSHPRAGRSPGSCRMWSVGLPTRRRDEGPPPVPGTACPWVVGRRRRRRWLDRVAAARPPGLGGLPRAVERERPALEAASITVVTGSRPELLYVQLPPFFGVPVAPVRRCRAAC